MKNQGQDLSNVEVVNQQIIQVKPIVDKTSGMVKLANKKFEEYTMCIQNKTIQFDGRRNVVTRTAHINLGADELTANETMQFLLQNPDLISNPVLLAEQAQAGKPILVDNNVLKGYIFLQEFSVPLIPLERGNTAEFLLAVIKSANLYPADSRHKFNGEFQRPLREALRRATGSSYDVVFDSLCNPDTAEFDLSLVLETSKEFQSKLAKELNYVFFEKKTTGLKKAGASGAFLREGNNFIFRYNFFTNVEEKLKFYKDMPVAHTNQVELRKDRRAQRAIESLASEVSEEIEETVEETTNAKAPKGKKPKAVVLPAGEEEEETEE